MSRRDVLVCAALGVCLSANAIAGNAPPDYSWQWSTVGDVGNPAIRVNHLGQPPLDVGGVDYEYRIATTEVTWSQYHEFITAYAPQLGSSGWSSIESGSIGTPGGIVFTGYDSQGVQQFIVLPGSESHAARGHWGYFARMANWLHNGAPGPGEATSDTFHTGAYTLSPDGFEFDGQPPRNEGALYWIPSRDEWVKAMSWDPNKHGEGQGGYWQFPNMTDDTLTPGRPEAGGETSAGTDEEWPEGQERVWDTASYPDVQSPWGLLDGSGSAIEWTDDFNPAFTRTFYTMGSQIGDPLWYDTLGLTLPSGGPRFGARFASAIPAPGGCGAILCFAIGAARRQRRRDGAHSA